MSITDIAAGRMRPARPFGQRRASSIPPVRPRQPRLSLPISQACRAYLRQLRTCPADLGRRAAFASACLQALIELRAPSLPRFPDLARFSLNLPKRLARLSYQGLKSFLRVLRPALSPRAIARGLFLSDISTTLIRLLAYLGGLAMLGIMALHMSRALPSIERSEPAPQPEWMQVAKPFPSFSIAMPELAESGRDYVLRRHVTGGGRQDILTWGELKGAAPHLMVEIYRPLAESAAFDSPEREIAARLIDTDAGTIRTAGEIETKFGRVALVEFSLGEPARQCLGFVRSHQNPQLQILGWQCISGAAKAERDTAACALDRLSLVSAGSDPKLREFFARAELKRNFCGQRSHILAPTPKLGPAALPSPEIKRGRLAAG